MGWCASRSRVKCRASTPRWRRRLCCTRCCGSEPAPVPSAPPHPDESFLDGGFEELGGVRHPELLHHVGAVRFDGLYADLEACPDLPVLEAVPDQLEDFLLAVRQGRGPVSLLPFHDRITPYAKRSEEHTSELQSPCNLVCRLLLEKKKKTITVD